MDKQLSKAQVQKIARRLAERYGEKYVDIPYDERSTPRGDSYYGPWVFPGAHEEVNSDWIISWEMCPAYEWSYGEFITEVTREVAPEFYAEAVNHLCVGFYEA